MLMPHYITAKKHNELRAFWISSVKQIFSESCDMIEFHASAAKNSIYANQRGRENEIS
jgi:hypothetical protein